MIFQKQTKCVKSRYALDYNYMQTLTARHKYCKKFEECRASHLRTSEFSFHVELVYIIYQSIFIE